MADHGFTGWVAAMKRSGTAGGGLSNGAQRNILSLEVNPSSPRNNSYMNVVNRGGYPNSVVIGRGSPALQIHTYLKPYNSTATLPGSIGWSDAAFFNSCLGLGTDNNTDLFDFALNDEIVQRQYNWGRCGMVELSGSAVSGPIATRLAYNCRWGDTANGTPECPYGTTLASGEVIPAAPTFTTPGYPDAGLAANVIATSITGMNAVKSFNVMIIRPQTPQYHFNGDRAPEDIVSSQLSGLLTVEQESDASTVASSTCTINFCTDKTSTTGRFSLSLLLNLDNMVENVIPGIMSTVRTYSLFDISSGGNPCVFAAY
jgi:hypothetical protein